PRVRMRPRVVHNPPVVPVLLHAPPAPPPAAPPRVVDRPAAPDPTVAYARVPTFAPKAPARAPDPRAPALLGVVGVGAAAALLRARPAAAHAARTIGPRD